MGTNVILAVGALVIFGTFLASSNRLMTVNTQIAEQNEYYISAISLAQSIISEAKAKAFDENTVSGSVPSPDSLSLTLGPDGFTESVPTTDTLITSSPYDAQNPGYRSTFRFNDVDDYDGYKRLVNTPRAEGYTLTVRVAYASPTYPDSMKSSPTFCKKMTVSVKSPFIPDSLSLSYAFVY